MTAQQQAWLKAMGIEVWQLRQPVAEAVETVQPEPAQHEPVSDPVPVSEAETKPDTDTATLDWPALQTVIAGCQRCSLAAAGKRLLLGNGSQQAELLILAEPAMDSASSQLLTAMLKAIGLQRQQVYITSLTKCATTDGMLQQEQVDACAAYLQRQISLLQPKAMLVLGLKNAQLLLHNKSTLSRLRGQFHYLDEATVPVLVSFDPAYLLQSPNEKRKAWDDLKMIRTVLQQ